MEITVPVKLDVNLTPDEICKYIRNWVYPILEEQEKPETDWTNVKPIIKRGKIYWIYHKIAANLGYGYVSEQQQKEIKITNKRLKNLCKHGLSFLEAYEELLASQKYPYYVRHRPTKEEIIKNLGGEK